MWKTLELPKINFKWNQVWRGLGQFRIKKLFPGTIIHKIFETNSSFHVKYWNMGKFWFLLFSRFLLVSTFLFWTMLITNNSASFNLKVVKEKFAKTSKRLEILRKWLSAKFCFTSMFLLTAPLVKSSHI